MLQKSTAWKVAGVFFKEPTEEHYLKEISRKAGIAHTSVKKQLELLKIESIIKETIQRKESRKFPVYKANINNGSYINEKKHYNLHNHSFYGLKNFLSLKLMPKTMVLFGSYSQGRDIEDSDIDIFVECKKQEIDVSEYETELNRKVQLHFNERFKSLSKELKNNIINGVILTGFLEAF